MASILCTLSLVILVLANSCFTLPVLNEDIYTISSLNNDLTTDHTSTVQLASDYNATVVPILPLRRSSDKHMGFELSTLVNNLPKENAFQAPRTLEELSTSEPLIGTTEQSMVNNRDSKVPSILTTERSAADKRGSKDSLDLTTERFAEDKHGSSDELILTTERFAADKRGSRDSLDLTTERSAEDKHGSNDDLDLTTERSAEDKRQFSVLLLGTGRPAVLTTEGSVHHKLGQDDSSFATVEPAVLTTEKSVKVERGFSDLLYGIVEPLLFTTERAITNESSSVNSSFATVEPSVLTTEKSVKSEREFSALLYDIVEPLLFTTEQVMTNESTHSDVSFTTVKPITQVDQIQKRNFENGAEVELGDESTAAEISTVPSKSTRKYISHLEDNSKQVKEQERLRKPLKPQRKLKISSTTTRDYNVESEETSKDSTVPTAVLDQDASKKISNVPSDFLILDETVDIIVTNLPGRLSNTTMQNTKEAKPLNQGQKSSDIEEKESDN